MLLTKGDLHKISQLFSQLFNQGFETYIIPYIDTEIVSLRGEMKSFKTEIKDEIKSFKTEIWFQTTTRDCNF